MMMRFDTLKDLYDKLIRIEFLKDKIQLHDEKIEIVFHRDCVLNIKLCGYFNIYMNNILCCNNIEDQDIWEIMHSYLQNDAIYVEFDGLLGKRKISELDRNKYELQKERLQGKQNVKIYTIMELIYQFE
ncbi:MAG: hypothetical protein WDA65_09275 [Christensenellales bacterium]